MHLLPSTSHHTSLLQFAYSKASTDCMFMFNSASQIHCSTKTPSLYNWIVNTEYIRYVVLAIKCICTFKSKTTFCTQISPLFYALHFFFVGWFMLCVIFRELTQFHFYYKIYVCLPFPICAMARKNPTCFKIIYCAVDCKLSFVQFVSGSDGVWKILISIERMITWLRVDLFFFLFFVIFGFT